MKTQQLAVGLVAVVAAGWMGIADVAAQEITPEDAVSPRTTPTEDVDPDEEEPRLQWDFRLTSEMHSSDNVGLRELDDSQADQERIETDDRHTFSYTSMWIGAQYRVLDDTTLRASASHNGLWGSNQLGGTNEFGGFFFVYDLHVDWTAIDSDWLTLSAKLGRQYFDIGGTHRDFFFRDQVDGLTFDLDFGDVAGRLRILAIDLYSSQGRPDNINFLRWHAGDNLVYNFRGDTNTFRYGGVYENTGLVDGLDLRAFGFFSTIGAAGTGAERTHQGELGNFTDNDFTWLAGTRIGYTVDFEGGSIRPFGEYARSGGIDRKEVNVGLHDVLTEGNAFGGGILSEITVGGLRLDGVAQYFYADGPRYDEAQGIQFSHGFTSFRGNYIGGLNNARYAGWRPSAYVGRRGIEHGEHDIQRASGTQMIHGGIGVGISPGLRLDLGAWHFRDTGRSNLSAENVEEAGHDLPFGYTRDELEAQERLGRDLGMEFNASLSYQANEALQIYGMGGIFLPGEFYEVEVSRNVGSSRGSADNLQNFWAITGGASLRF